MNTSIENPHENSFHVRSATELEQRAAELKLTEYLISGLIAQHEISLIVGDSGIGKSPLLYQAAVCVATGAPFLERTVKKGRVLVMDGENGIARVRDTIERLKSHLRVPTNPEALDSLSFWNINDAGNGYGSSGHKLEDIIRASKPDWVILDPINVFYPSMEKSAEDAVRVWNTFRNIMSQVGCAITCTHHRHKQDKIAKLPALENAELDEWFQEARGSSVLISGSDSRIAIGRAGDDELIIRGRNRGQTEFPPLYVARVFDAEGEAVGFSKAAGKKLTNPEHIKAYEKLPEKFRFKDAASALGKSDGTCGRFLSLLLALGLAVKNPDKSYKKVPNGVDSQMAAEAATSSPLLWPEPEASGAPAKAIAIQ